MALDEAIRRAILLLLQSDRPPRVLIVGPRHAPTRLLALLLRTCGFEAWAPRDGLLAAAAARLFRPQYIVLDASLPGLDCGALAARLRGEPTLPGVVLIVSAAVGPVAAPSPGVVGVYDHVLLGPLDIGSVLPLLAAARCGARRRRAVRWGKGVASSASGTHRVSPGRGHQED